MTNTKKRRFYRINEKVWVKDQKTTGTIKSLDVENYVAKVSVNGETEELKFWEIDKLRDKPKSPKKDTILFAKVRESATIPSKNREDAGYDIYADFEQGEFVFNPHETRLVPTGIASSVLDKYALIVKERGSTGTKGMAVRAGVVDSGYRGEIFVAITNENDQPLVIAKEDSQHLGKEGVIYYPYTKAIAQLLLVIVPDVDVKEIPYDKLKDIPSVRGEGKLGESGK